MVPDPNDPRWSRILSSESDLSAASLATKFLITRLRRELKTNPGNMGGLVAELRVFFEKNTFAQPDIALL
jgi:hypothetical protein